MPGSRVQAAPAQLHADRPRSRPAPPRALLAALHRSGNPHSGFTVLIRARNFICAAPLVRLQLDNCRRFYAAFLVSDPQQLSLEVFGGKPVRKMKSRDGGG